MYRLVTENAIYYPAHVMADGQAKDPNNSPEIPTNPNGIHIGFIFVLTNGHCMRYDKCNIGFITVIDHYRYGRSVFCQGFI